jgi:hypothetical protein
MGTLESPDYSGIGAGQRLTPMTYAACRGRSAGPNVASVMFERPRTARLAAVPERWGARRLLDRRRRSGGGRFGVAIQTAWPFVGTTCPYRVRVGAVTTQSFTEGSRPERAGPARSGGRATSSPHPRTDPGRAVRQVGIVDADGGAASWTGGSCAAAAAT